MDKWAMLKEWIGERHDYFEKQYKKTNFSADASELGAFRSVYNAMEDIEAMEAKEKNSDPLALARRAGK
jgi:hypothetical protein